MDDYQTIFSDLEAAYAQDLINEREHRFAQDLKRHWSSPQGLTLKQSEALTTLWCDCFIG